MWQACCAARNCGELRLMPPRCNPMPCPLMIGSGKFVIPCARMHRHARPGRSPGVRREALAQVTAGPPRRLSPQPAGAAS
jgi:hypothetical protein